MRYHDADTDLALVHVHAKRFKTPEHLIQRFDQVVVKIVFRQRDHHVQAVLFIDQLLLGQPLQLLGILLAYLHRIPGLLCQIQYRAETVILCLQQALLVDLVLQQFLPHI